MELLSAGGRCLPGLQASLCPPSTGTEHARSLGRAAVEACFRAYKNACPGPVWISTESFAECSSCQDSTFQKAMHEGSGVGRYSLTDCALLARLKKQPRSAAVHQPRRRNGPHEPSTAHLPHPSWPRWYGERGRGRQQGSGLEARGPRQVQLMGGEMPSPQPTAYPLVATVQGGKGRGWGGNSRTSDCLGKPELGDWTQETPQDAPSISKRMESLKVRVLK